MTDEKQSDAASGQTATASEPSSGSSADRPPDEGSDRSLGPGAKVGLIVAAAAAVSALVTIFVDPQTIGQMGRGMGPGMGPGRDPDPATLQFENVQLFLSTFNVILLSILAGTYVQLYRQLPNRFTFSLILFSVALLLYALASNPAVHLLFGYRGTGLGPFVFLPDLFAAVAVTVLLYQSYQ